MRHFSEILAAYEELDRILDTAKPEALKAGDQKKAERIERRQKLNDHAYFVLLFGQFEVGLTEQCRNAIRARRGDADWSRRRGWDLYNPDDKRMSGLPFEDRVALVVDKQSAQFKTIMRYYEIRNTAAHGDFRGDELDIPQIAADLQTLFGRLVS